MSELYVFWNEIFYCLYNYADEDYQRAIIIYLNQLFDEENPHQDYTCGCNPF